MGTYHDIHYQTFHMSLPQMVLSGGIADFVAATRAGLLPSLLADVWARNAQAIVQSARMEPDLIQDASRFGFLESRDTPGWSIVLIATPEIREGLEAIMVAVAFDEALVRKPLYFTCEAPMFQDGPFMIGQWTDFGQRSNLGPMFEVSADAMLAFVAGRLPVDDSADSPRRSKPRQEDLRSIPDIDDVLGSTRSGDAKPTSGSPVEGRERLMPDASTRPSSEPVRVSGPIKFNLTWSANPPELASETLTNLYRLVGSGGRALVLKTKKAKGLGKKVSSYVQFMWTEDEILSEIQGDYSYWGLSVPSKHWSQFERCGLIVPTGGVGNFQRRLQPSISHEEKLKALTEIFGAFISVLQPTGSIQELHF